MLSHRRAIIRSIHAAADRLGPHAPWITLLDAAGAESVLTPPHLIAGANAWAHHLAARGLKPGDRVIICLDHGTDLYLAYLGALLIGCVPSFAAATSPKQPVAATLQALEHLLVNTAPRALVKEDALSPGNAANVILVSPSAVQLGADAPDYWNAPAPPAYGEEAFAFIQYSSGTTGAKKGVGITEQMLQWQLERYAASLHLSKDDRIVSWLPLYHDMGLMTAYFLPLMQGVRLISMSPFEWVKTPQMLLRAIDRYKATLCWLPNFAYEFLARYAGEARTTDLSSVRMFVNCSEPIMASSHAKFLAQFATAGVRETALGTCYAMAETTYAISASRPGEPARKRLYQSDAAQPPRELVSSGAPVEGASVKIIDAEDREVPRGTQGRICVKMPSLFGGYLRGAAVDTSSFLDGWHVTGDIGLLDDDGELYVLGRADDVIIVAGQNIFPQDIEAIVNEVEGAISGRNVAFGVFEPQSGTEALVVLVEVRDPAAAAAAGLDRAIAGRINAGAGISPKQVRLVPHMSLVKSTSGKISRKINRERYLAEHQAQPASSATPLPAAPAGDIAETIRQSVSAVLARKSGSAPRFGDTEALFEFGLLDSLSFVDLVVELETRTGRPVPQAIVDNPRAHDTVAAMAAAFAQPAAPSSAAAGSAKLLSARERRQQLSPHMADTDRTPLEPRAYVMFMPQPNFTSPSANTDEYGFRIALKQGRRLVLRKMRAAKVKKGILLGNSQIWGTGASKDENVVHNVLNAARKDECWYSFALRNSTLTQERLAAELHAPLDASYAVWVSGTVTLNMALTNFSHARIFPFPSQARFMALMRAPPGFDLEDAPGEQRWREVLDLFEREMTLFGRLFRNADTKPMFVMQPVIVWCDKPWSPEELEVNSLFRAEGGKAAHAPETFTNLAKMFVTAARAICARRGVTFVNAADHDEFRVKDWLFVDGAHMTDAGHRALATVISRSLE